MVYVYLSVRAPLEHVVCPRCEVAVLRFNLSDLTEGVRGSILVDEIKLHREAAEAIAVRKHICRIPDRRRVARRNARGWGAPVGPSIDSRGEGGEA